MHVIFESQFEAEVIGLLHREVAVPDYVRLDGLVGARAVKREGRKAYRADDRNSMAIIVCADDVAGQLMAGVEALCERVEHGVCAYVTDVERVVSGDGGSRAGPDARA